MSRAIVCDKCGKVMLLEDNAPFTRPNGVYTLLDDKRDVDLDLCGDCAAELLEIVRRTSREID